MNIDLKNFNPTYLEAYRLLEECDGVLKLYRMRSVAGYDAKGKDYNELLTLRDALEYAIRLSKMTNKIRKFDNDTYEVIQTRLKTAESEADRLKDIIIRELCWPTNDEESESESSNDDEPDVFNLYENKLDEIRELKNKLDYIESHYRVDVSKG